MCMHACEFLCVQACVHVCVRVRVCEGGGSDGAHMALHTYGSLKTAHWIIFFSSVF